MSVEIEDPDRRADRSGVRWPPAAAVLAAPAAAGAVTLTGSGSSAAQPYMLELFKGYSKIHHNIQFKYIAGRRQRRRQGRAGRARAVLDQHPPAASPATPARRTRSCSSTASASPSTRPTRSATSRSATLKNIFLGVDTSWSQVRRLEPVDDDRPDRPQLGRRAVHVLPAVGARRRDAGRRTSQQDTSDGLVQVGVGHDPNAIGYVGLAHSGKPVKALSVNGVPCKASTIRSKTYPLFRFDWGVIPTNARQRQGRAVPRLGADEHGRRQDHQQGRRGRRLQQVGTAAGHRDHHGRGIPRARGATVQSGPARRAWARRAGLWSWSSCCWRCSPSSSRRRGRRSPTTACTGSAPAATSTTQIQAIFTSGDLNQAPQFLFHAWPLIWSTILTTGGAVVISFVCSLFVAVFMVEFAPDAGSSAILEPVVRLLASVPSVIYGLIGVLVRRAVHRQPPDHPAATRRR